VESGQPESTGLSEASKKTISSRKLQANRENSKKSTGPKTSAGKAISSWNSIQHGLLSKRLATTESLDKEAFACLLASLQQDLEPVGTLEEVLVEKIAHEYWRLGELNQDTSRANRAAKRGPVFITDRGHPSHVLLTAEEYERKTPMGTQNPLRLTPRRGSTPLAAISYLTHSIPYDAVCTVCAT